MNTSINSDKEVIRVVEEGVTPFLCLRRALLPSGMSTDREGEREEGQLDVDTLRHTSVILPIGAVKVCTFKAAMSFGRSEHMRFERKGY